MVLPTWPRHIQVLELISGHSLLTRNNVVVKSCRQHIALTLLVKDLARQVVLQIDETAFLQHEVEVVSGVAEELNEVSFRESAWHELSLVNGMLSVEIQVPRDDVDEELQLINDEQLHQVFDSGGVDAFEPDLVTELDIEVSWNSCLHLKNLLASFDIRDLSAALGD